MASLPELLRELDIIFWPDSDWPGETYIANAAKCLEGTVASLRVVRPFGKPNGAKGCDVCDWEGDAEALAKLAENAEPYAPLLPDKGLREQAAKSAYRGEEVGARILYQCLDLALVIAFAGSAKPILE
ncbi:MAG: hypothetical protein WBW81_14195, partial [Methylocella sp.]